jgi:hypothetical protein
MDPSQFNFGDDSGEEASEDFSVATDFLKGIPDQDRSIVEKYVKNWDAEVTRKFQGIHEQYKPYKDLGADPDSLSQSWRIYQALNQDPVATLKLLQEAVEEMYPYDEDGDYEQPVGQQNDQPWRQTQQPALPEYEGLPQEFVQTFQSMQQQIEQMSQALNNTQQSITEKEQNQMLDNLLSQLHTEHGEFDEDYILLQLSKGKSPQEAIEAWSNFVDGVANSRRKAPAPPIFGGQGGVPNGQVDPSKIKDPSMRRQLIAQILEASNQ